MAIGVSFIGKWAFALGLMAPAVVAGRAPPM